MTISAATIQLCIELLDQVQIPVGHPDFEYNAQRAITAKHELGEALAAQSLDMAGD